MENRHPSVTSAMIEAAIEAAHLASPQAVVASGELATIYRAMYRAAQGEDRDLRQLALAERTKANHPWPGTRSR